MTLRLFKKTPLLLFQIALAVLVSPLAAAGAAQACGAASPCAVSGGEYRIRMPQGWDGKTSVGAIVFMHGWKGTAAAVMSNAKLQRVVSDLGLALIAPQGAGKTWSFPSSPSRNRDEIAFIDTLLDDALARYPIDPDRVMASGFSLGGSMTWYLACYLGDRFAGFAPIAGAFWAPLPEKCPGPQPNLIHMHGTSDKTVPLTGRLISSHARQGDVGEGMALWLEKGGCAAERPRAVSDQALSCQRRVACGGKILELCLHSGGHKYEPEWLKRAWMELAELKGWRMSEKAPRVQ